jgi:hypothetical protein
VNQFIGSTLVVTTISSYTLKITGIIAHATSHNKSSNYSSGHTVVPLELRNSSEVNSEVEVEVTLRLTASQSVSLGVEPHLGLMTRYLLLFCQLRSCFFGGRGALSDERTGLPFVYTADPCQRRTQPIWGPRYMALGRTQQKTQFFYCRAHIRFCGNLFTEPLLRNGLHNPVVLLLLLCCGRYLATAVVYIVTD